MPCPISLPARRLTVILLLGSSVIMPDAVAAQRPAERQVRVAAPAARVTLPQFAQLRWLEGAWRGELPDGGHFFERYTIIDDSTIAMTAFTDSTLARSREGDRIRLRDGTVQYENVVATAVGGRQVTFATTDGRSGFAWARTSDSTWTATLRRVDAGGGEQRTVYRLSRIPDSRDPRAADREAVRRAALDYLEGFYEGDSTPLLRSIAPHVFKYGYGRARAPESGYRASQMRFPEGFLGYARRVREGAVRTPEGAPKEITIYDVEDQTASAKVRAWWGIDYLLLGREDGRWKITHVLWQATPPRQ